uniref:NADH-ubiquinone oxidoreductase chain 6 n=1 Tax=Lysmata boggessi TaxID=497604 RepID=A0A8F5CFF5_9EUCA|nr:NADH dehydrogenase subunit 6 [Lysmata boggessi]QVT15584.1 NADH dehydrogenase subunit 6 [Lysmata boggessi]QXJ42676.1 NADH dehydrogenase subunit 6 [Lysmata boggessi]
MTTLISLMLLNSFMSIIFIKMFSPLAMGSVLLLQTILVCTATGITFKSMWFSYILFLIFLGAMLVLFIYVASLASNQQFFFSLKLSMFMLMVFLMSFTSIVFVDSLSIFQIINVERSSVTPNELLTSSPLLLSMIYSMTSMNLTVFVILYLLLTLVVVVKITGFFYGPLRVS